MASFPKRYALLALALAAIMVMGLGINVQRDVGAYENVDEAMKKLKVLTSVLVTIQNYYVDPEKTDEEELINGAIHGMVNSLDRYSAYLEPDEAQEFNDKTQGSFGGLGIQIDMVDGWLTVIEPLPNTPASEAGLMSGDRIVAIEGESTKGINIYEAIKKLKGEPGTQVTITIARKDEDEFIDVSITRDIIRTRAVEQEEVAMLDDSVGYIRLRDFTRDAANELRDSIESLQNQGMNGLILDLRDNVGGLLDVAVAVCDLFVPEGKVIVSHRNNQGVEKVYKAEGGQVGDFALVVLVNEFSASASEIVAGCVQDHRRGILIGPSGHRTFGKGSVQTLIESKELQGAALKITTAKYYTPSGRSIEDLEGLKPDVFAQVTDDQRIAIRRADKVGYLPPEMTGKPEEESEETAQTEPAQSVEDLSVQEVFRQNEDDSSSETQEEDLYDIELYTAYQCLRSVLVLNGLSQEQYSLAPTRN